MQRPDRGCWEVGNLRFAEVVVALSQTEPPSQTAAACWSVKAMMMKMQNDWQKKLNHEVVGFGCINKHPEVPVILCSPPPPAPHIHSSGAKANTCIGSRHSEGKSQQREAADDGQVEVFGRDRNVNEGTLGHNDDHS